jgi:VWFA-related protein
MSLFGFTCSRSFGWVTCLLIVLSISFTAVEAQSPQQQATQKPSQDEVVTVKTNLVNIDVLVKDNKGNYISDLEAEDFIVFENGVEQKLEFLDSPLSRDKEKNKPKASTEGGQQLISREQPRNLVALVLDGQTTDLPNLKRVREGTIKYIREQITPQDTVAVFAVTSGLQLLQPFTQDKTRLVAAVAGAYGTSTSSKNFETRDISENIEKLREQSSNTATGPITTAAAGSQAAQAMIASRVLQQFIRLRTALSVQQSRPILAALAAICEGLRAVPGKKTLVLFSQGFVTPAVLDWQVQSTIDLANRANVAIYIIDSAGLREGGTYSGSLVPATPLAGVSASTNQEQRIQTTGGENVFDTVRQEGVNRQYDILFRISGDTGGEFLKGSNDIARGLARIDEQIRSRYTLAYRSTDQNFDGDFRKIKIELRKPQGQVISRPGYYAIAHEDVVLLSPEEKKLAASIVMAEANPDFPMFVELSSFRSREDLYVVPLSFEVPSSALKFERKDDKQWIHLEVVGLIRDARDKILSRLGGNFDVGLTAAQYNSIVNNNIFYRQDLEIPVGGYKLELVVRDKLSGKMAGKTEQFLLPQMDAGFMASPVVLSRQATSSQLSSAAEPGDVLSLGPVRIRPSPSHEFRADDNLIIFFEIYNAARNTETATPLVRVTVTLKKDNKTAIGPVDYVLTDVLMQPVPHLTFAKYISLKGLSPGKYMAVLETRDMVNRDLVKQTLPFIVAP